MKNKVIKLLTAAHGKVVVAYWKAVGIDVLGYPGRFNEKDGDSHIYYGVINGYFRNYSFKQVEEANAEIIEIPHNFLIGKKIRGFKGIGFMSNMKKYIGKIGTIVRVCSNTFHVKFEEGAIYYYDYIKAFDHLVDEETIKEVEIPALGVGVLMMVSDNDKTYRTRFVIGKTKEGYLAWAGAETADEIESKYAKFWEFAKPIEQKVILTKQDISDGKGVGVKPHLIEVV